MCGDNSTTEIIEEALEDGMKEDVTNPEDIEVLPYMTLRMLGWRFFRMLRTYQSILKRHCKELLISIL